MEHSRLESAADLAVQIASILLLLGLCVDQAPSGQLRLVMAALVPTGLVAWSLIEYCVHRFILHGLRPWSSWHAQHHRNPQRHVFAPTLLVSALFAASVFAPLLWLGNLWIACGFTLGVLCGYLFYSLTHLAIHHLGARGRWLRARQLHHAEHHRLGPETDSRYGVTTSFWDQVFSSAASLRRRHGVQ